MPATLDLTAVRRFAEDLNSRLHRCDNGEGMECSTLENTIRHYADLCCELQICVERWADAVFTGEIAFDPEVENLLKDVTRTVVERAATVAERARVLEGPCYDLVGLDFLYRQIGVLGQLLKNWVTPRLAVSPAPRVAIPEAAEQQMRDRLAGLTPLPAGWQPADPDQLAFFNKQHTE
jgi:hypothetical protein